MKGVILAGGKGTRLAPLTDATNKHLLPVGREPMIYHPIKQLVGAGVTELMVITSTDHMGDVVRCLGSGERLAEGFVGRDRFVVVLGDNVFEYSIAPYVRRFREQTAGARVLLKEVGDPERYGVAALDEKQVVEIEEKPAQPKSSYAVVGLYMYDAQVWDVIRTVEPSGRGELEITSVNNAYIQRGQLEYDICEGRWTDAGTFDSLTDANQILGDNNNQIRGTATNEQVLAHV